VYEPLWRIGPAVGAEPTSWLRLQEQPAAGIESLWHARCAELAGVDGG
jgi:hypothetical protein